jgi:hypothetical protein
MVTAGWFMLLNLDYHILVEVFLVAGSLQIFTPAVGWPAATRRTPA